MKAILKICDRLRFPPWPLCKWLIMRSIRILEHKLRSWGTPQRGLDVRLVENLNPTRTPSLVEKIIILLRLAGVSD